MKYSIDMQYLLESFQRIVAVPSPVGYPVKGNALLTEMASELGCSLTFDQRCNAYLTLDGEDNSKTILVGAHMDTIGMMVRSIDPDGKIRFRQLGGTNQHSLEGESVTICTRDGRTYTGLVACNSHSVHVFDDARTMERDEEHMMVLLDEKVSSREDVLALGIRHGDMIAPDADCKITGSGFVKSRFIDDKGAVAICFAIVKYLKENGRMPKYRTIFAFPYMEEIGLGGTFVPEGVSEYLALDIGLIGPGYEGNEYSVSICPKDKGNVYTYDLVSRLIDTAERNGISYAVDLFKNYGSDAGAAMRAGHDLKAVVFGTAVYCSHGVERTHVDGIASTANLLTAYLLGE